VFLYVEFGRRFVKEGSHRKLDNVV
jgi:hypothetical protein